MAIIKPPFEIVGSIRGMSFYKQYGSDKVIMRTKGGASKQKIKNSPKFAKLRLHQTEWGGCVKMSRSICCAMWHVIPLADFNVSAYMNGFAKKLQALDTEKPIGERRPMLSANKYLLDGFQLNRIHSFASILRVAPFWEIKRETMRITVSKFRWKLNTIIIQHGLDTIFHPTLIFYNTIAYTNKRTIF